MSMKPSLTGLVIVLALGCLCQAAASLAQMPEPDLPTSVDAIRAAVQQGEIDEEEALVYRVFALFGDERLPEKFRAAELGESHLRPLDEAADRFPELSPWAQEQILPFLLRPTSSGSWVELRLREKNPEAKITWKKIPVLGGRASIWYQTRYTGEDLRANDLARALGRTIWPALTRLAGHLPSSDLKIPDKRPGPDPDPGLDIYLVRGLRDPRTGRKAEGLTLCRQPAAFVQIDSLYTTSLLRGTLTHELWHVLQCAGGWFKQDDWLRESTAEWSIDFAYPRANQEHRSARELLNKPDEPLATTVNIERQYGAYLWFQYLVRSLNRPSLVPGVHRAVAKGNSFPVAVESVTGLPLSTLWPQFSLALLNRSGIAPFRQWDALADGARLDPVRLPGKTFSLPPLSALYLNIEASETNRDLRFTLPAGDGIKIQVARRSGGLYSPAEDWSSAGMKTLCSDPTPGTSSSGPAEAVVVIVSNSSPSTWTGTLGVERTSCDLFKVVTGHPNLIIRGTITQTGVNPCTQQFETRSWEDWTNIGSSGVVKYNGEWYDYTCECDGIPISPGLTFSFRRTAKSGSYKYTNILSGPWQPGNPPWPNFLPGTFETRVFFEADLSGNRRGAEERTSIAAGPVFPGCDAIGDFTWVHELTGSDVLAYEERLWGSVTEEYLQWHLTYECIAPPPARCAISFPEPLP